jgi:STE24 endopeptidase
MSPSNLTYLFAFALVASLAVQLWLATRQMRHVAQHRQAVPPAFAHTVGLQAHQRAADYTLAKGRFGLLTMAFSAAVLLGWTLLGGLDALNVLVRDAVVPRWGGMAYQLALMLAFMLIGGLLDLPFDLWSTFRIEELFGFNRTTWRLYLVDMVKGIAVGAVIGLPLLALILWLMAKAGPAWWLWAWAALAGFVLLMRVLVPTVIQPMFNKFEPLNSEVIQARAAALMQRCGFQAKGFFVMDGSKRSAHSNAYFTGLGAAKRVVFFDTLLTRLTPGEVEAVLAHELGHFKHKHLTQQTVMMLGTTLMGLALLGWLSGQSSFYQGLGVNPNMSAPNHALALLLFLNVVPVFSYFASPLMAQLSRKHEFQADAYACTQASGQDLASALLKLHEDNASTLTPDPLYVRFYYSHPPASERLPALTLRAS